MEEDPHAIAVTGARKRNVKVIGFDGKTPTYENVKNGKYVLYRPLYLVTNPAPSEKVKNFVRFARSPEGREILRTMKRCRIWMPRH